jgi:hypothetical protein
LIWPWQLNFNTKSLGASHKIPKVGDANGDPITEKVSGNDFTGIEHYWNMDFKILPDLAGEIKYISMKGPVRFIYFWYQNICRQEH